MGARISLAWPLERIEELKKLWAENKLSAQGIGDILGLSRNAILGKVWRLKLDPHKNSGNPNPNIKRRRTIPVVNFMKTKAPAIPLRPEPEPPAEFLGLTLQELTPNSCRYPQGDKAPYLYCGQPVMEKSSWCRDCAKKVFVPTRYSDPANFRHYRWYRH